MTLHKLSAGSGYEYLTRQVAALDSTEKGTTPLADYYSARGESPGHWVGSSLVGIDGLDAGDVVTAEQMKHLFGTGSHPLTGEQLGAAYKVYDNSGVDGFNAEVARRVRATGVSTGSTAGPPYGVLARVRSEVAREHFVTEHGREPATASRLARPSTNRGRTPSSGRPGGAKPSTCSGQSGLSSRWCRRPFALPRGRSSRSRRRGSTKPLSG
jgi:hypothetical protein